MDEISRGELVQGTTNRSSGSFELVGGAAAFSLIGYLVDSLSGLVPVFTIAFAVLGFTGAATSLYFRYVAEMSRLGEERRR